MNDSFMQHVYFWLYNVSPKKIDLKKEYLLYNSISIKLKTSKVNL